MRKLMHNKTTWILLFVFVLWLSVFAVNRKKSNKEFELEGDDYANAFSYDGQEQEKDINDIAGYNYENTERGEEVQLPPTVKPEQEGEQLGGAPDAEDTEEEAVPGDDSKLEPPTEGASQVDEPQEKDEEAVEEEEMRKFEEGQDEEEEGDSDMDDMAGAGREEDEMEADVEEKEVGESAPKAELEESNLYDGRFEIPKPDLLHNFSNNPEFERKLDTLSAAAIPFLPNYKNPCWFEGVNNPKSYFDNFFVLATDRNMRFMESFKMMQELIEDRSSAADGPGEAWRLRCLPAFYIPGVAKCGSTDLMMALTMHPDIIKGDMKELKYWNRVRHPHQSKRYQRAVEEHPILGEFPRPINHYLEALDYSAEKVRMAMLPPVDSKTAPFHQKLIGDGTPSYMWDFDSWSHMELNKGFLEPRYTVAHYIRQVTPDAKLIFILRNPTDRLYSDYKGFQKQKKKSRKFFHELCVAGIKSLDDCLHNRTMRSCLYDYEVNNREDVLPVSSFADDMAPSFPEDLVDNEEEDHDKAVRVRVGMYYHFLKDWFDVFPREQIFLIQLEDYSERREEILAQLFEFLGLGPMPQDKYDKLKEVGVRNKAARRMRDRLGGDMYEETKRLLDAFYKPYNEQLAAFLKDDKYLWK
uniref:Sulfotransferase domain-containing protein n=1 Tax=Capitella teleta TaxID=283909 RepID=X2AX35_CAPTE